MTNKGKITEWQLKIFDKVEPIEKDHDKLWSKLNPLLEEFAYDIRKQSISDVFRAFYRRMITEKFLVRRNIIELEKAIKWPPLIQIRLKRDYEWVKEYQENPIIIRERRNGNAQLVERLLLKMFVFMVKNQVLGNFLKDDVNE